MLRGAHQVTPSTKRYRYATEGNKSFAFRLSVAATASPRIQMVSRNPQQPKYRLGLSQPNFHTALPRPPSHTSQPRAHPLFKPAKLRGTLKINESNPVITDKHQARSKHSKTILLAVQSLLLSKDLNMVNTLA